MPTERPSSIQNPAFSSRVRRNADSAVSASRNAGTAIRWDSTTRHGRASWTLATAAKLAARSGRQRRPQAQHGAPAVVRVDDVDRVVLPVGAGDAEEDRQPSARTRAGPRATSSARKTSARPTWSKSTPACCGTPLTKTSKASPTCGGSSTWLRASTLYTMPVGVRRTALATRRREHRRPDGGRVAYAGNGGFLPGERPFAERAPHRQTPSSSSRSSPASIFLIVEGALITFIIKYRRGKRARTAEGPQIHGSTRLEILWTVVPGPDPRGDRDLRLLQAARHRGRAEGERRRRDDDQGRGPSVLLALPLPERRGLDRPRWSRRPTRSCTRTSSASTTTSSTAGGCPTSAARYDAIPGRTNKTWFEAPAGDYIARCAELCGIQHALMDGAVDVVPRAAVRRVHRGRAPRTRPSSALGKEEWPGVCAVVPPARPRLHRPGARRQPAAHRREGPDDAAPQRRGQMPAVGRNWTDDQIDALVAYTKHLREGEAAPRWPSTSRPSTPYRADWRRGRRDVVADDRRPQADRDPLHLDVAHLLRARRHPRAADAHAARDAERARS